MKPGVIQPNVKNRQTLDTAGGRLYQLNMVQDRRETTSDDHVIRFFRIERSDLHFRLTGPGAIPSYCACADRAAVPRISLLAVEKIDWAFVIDRRLPTSPASSLMEVFATDVQEVTRMESSIRLYLYAR